MRRLLLVFIPLALLPWFWHSRPVDAALQQEAQQSGPAKVAPQHLAPAVVRPKVVEEPQGFAGAETCALCHADLAKKFSSNPHSELALMHGGKGVTCESCHGPGQAHVASGGDPTKILQLDKMSAHQVDATCLGCHADAHPNFLRSEHAKSGVGCESCHSIHGFIPATSPAPAAASLVPAATNPTASSAPGADATPPAAATAHPAGTTTTEVATPADTATAPVPTLKKSSLSARFFSTLKPDGSTRNALPWSSAAMDVPRDNPALLRASQPTLCYSCHTDVQSAFSQPFHHKVDEGLMKCSDCHDTHGTFQGKQLRSSADQNAACVRCHSETAGPFVYEHPVVKTNGCVACHSPHGSPNARLLNVANINTMCLQCHSSINLAAFPNTPSEQGGPVHNQATQYVACTNCHSQIHGSNAASNFFR